MTYLQHEHVEECFYKRDESSHMIDTKQTFLNKQNASFLIHQRQSFIEPVNKSYFTASRKNFSEQSNKHYYTQSNISFSNELKNGSQFLLYANNNFFQLEKDHFLKEEDNVIHHLEEDNIHHVEEDKIHHLEESEGETSDDENEDFCHLIDWNTRLPPLWEPIMRQVNNKNITLFKCKLTNKVQSERPTILERFEVFDLTVEELIESISRYEPNNPIKKYRELISKKTELHSSELQPVALESLRVWKHHIESKLLHSDVMEADYSDRKQMGIDKRSAAERKQARIEALRQKEDKRYVSQNVSRNQQQRQFQQSNQQRINQRQQARRNVANQRQQKFDESAEHQRHQVEQLQSRAINLQRDEEKLNEERLIKTRAKEYELKILHFLDENSCGFVSDMLATAYYFKYNEEWQPEKWFNDPLMENDIMRVFTSFHLRDEIRFYIDGTTTIIIHQKHAAKLNIHGFDTNSIVNMLQLSSSIDECIRKLKAEKLALQEARRQIRQKPLPARPQSRQSKINKQPRRLSARRVSARRVSAQKSTVRIQPKPQSSTYGLGLPGGWEAKRTKKGKIYFIDHNTKKTSWEDPRPLPPGWRSGKTQAGKVYFISDSTKKTQWNDPRPKLRIF